MEHNETISGEEQNEKFGVLDYHVDNGHYVVNVRWKDGEKTTKRFPVVGFTIINPANKERLGSMDGKKALAILQEHAGDYAYEEFSWRDFLNT